MKGLAKQEDIDGQESLPKDDLDFYWEPLRVCWYTDGEGDEVSPLQALHIKKQIVLYGPPGTGKTYQSRDIAGGLIRQELLKLWVHGVSCRVETHSESSPPAASTNK